MSASGGTDFPRRHSTVRLLDWAAVGAAAWLGSALCFWSGWSASFWMRPEHVFLFLLVIVAVRLSVAPVAAPALDPRRVLGLGVAVYALAFSFITVTRHFAFRTHALDLGYYVQLTWNLARGHGPWVSLPEMNAWGDHLSPIMYLFAPVFWLAPGPVALLVGQAVMLAAGAVAVFGIARRRHLPDGTAAAFAIVYLLNPSLHGITVRDFHAAALAIPLLLAGLYFALADRHWLFVAAIVLTLTCREDAALPVLGVGVWLGLARRRWIAGGAMALGAFALLEVDVTWLIPHFRHEPYAHLGRYAALGHTLGEVIAGVVLHPIVTVEGLLTGGRLIYLVAMLAPLGFLPLLGGWGLVGAVPALAENLLSSDPVLYDYRTQYQSFVLPFLLLAAIGGYSRLATRWRGARPVAVLGAAFALSLALASPAANDLAVARWWPDAEQRAAWSVLARVPAAASISAQERYVPHLALRRLVTVFPVALDRVDYVLVNERAYPWRDLPDVVLERAGNAVAIVAADSRTFRYRVAAQSGPHLLLERSR